jgi:DNA-binding response OmpR family regulator
MTRPRILVIDDNLLLRDTWCDFLTMVGYEVIAARDGAEGLALLDSGSHDIVVTDLFIPGLDGWQVIDAVRRRRPGTPVILITGSATEADRERARAAGVEMLEKPVGLRELHQVVDSALSRVDRASPPADPPVS